LIELYNGTREDKTQPRPQHPQSLDAGGSASPGSALGILLIPLANIRVFQKSNTAPVRFSFLKRSTTLTAMLSVHILRKHQTEGRVRIGGSGRQSTTP
jgi:hypothetical protein